MTAKERQENNEVGDGVIYFDEPAFVQSIIGTTFDTPARVVYDYNMMIEEYANHHKVSQEEAADYVCYNCIRSASYFGDQAPIITYPLLV